MVCKDNVTADSFGKAFDEVYQYDGLDRLLDYWRGALVPSSQPPAMNYSTVTAGQVFMLSGTGTWDREYTYTGSGYAVDIDSYDAANELSEAGVANSFNPQYDNAGNMTTVLNPLAGSGGLTAKYDAWNRLVEVDTGSTVLAQYEYDGLGRKVEDLTNFVSGVASSVTHYYYGNGQVIETRTAAPGTAPATVAPQYQYVWSAVRDAPILRDTINPANGQPTTDARIYYLTDADNNVTAIADQNGSVEERYLYTPYGQVQDFSVNWTANSDTSGNSILFACQELDTATGLYYFNARWYNVLTGSFITRDPLDLAAGPNMYEYCDDNPISNSDPTGTTTITMGDGTYSSNNTISDPVASGTSCFYAANSAVEAAYQADLARANAITAYAMNLGWASATASWRYRYAQNQAVSSWFFGGRRCDVRERLPGANRQA